MDDMHVSCRWTLSFRADWIKPGSFDSSVHISEEASNAAVAVPWAIVSAIGIAGVLGWGIQFTLYRLDVR